MLLSLSIRNFAIIESLDIEFGPGLNVLTGETGAGKSIVIGALNVILGGRAGSEMVRGGADRAVVDAVFDIACSPRLIEIVREMGYDADDGQLLLTREISANGKSTARIGGRISSAGQLRDIGDGLVDLHGQHEHQSLLAVARHLDILDEWGGPDLFNLKTEVGAVYRELHRLKEEHALLETNARERAHLLDLYQFQVNEIDEASLVPGEDDELLHDARKLANAQRLAETSATACAVLSGDDGPAFLDLLAAAARGLEEAAALDEKLTPMLESLNSARYELDEIARDLAHYRDSVEFNPERLQQIEDRLELIRGLKRKYGDTIEEITEYRRQTATRLDSLLHGEERGDELDNLIRNTGNTFSALCRDLSLRRRTHAKEFADGVLTELADLAMEKTRFDVSLEPCEPGIKGAEKVEFVIAPNPGEPMRSLSRIASGGEMSRVMLAIKSAMSRQEPLPTMVFDEIDVGVGGRTASVIADKLEALAKSAQVLCITHLPQIASRGVHHYYIEKSSSGDRTVVSVTPLRVEERIGEIARMLGGNEVTETVVRHAREMLRLD